MDIGIGSRHKGPALQFAIHDEFQGWRLHATSGLCPADPAPEHGGHFEPIQTIKNPTGFLRVHQSHIQVPGLFGGRSNTLWRNFVEHHAGDGNLGLQYLQQMPRDGLAFAILICCEHDF